MKNDGPIEINIKHTRHGGWNRHEVAVQKEVQQKLNHVLTSFDVGLSAFKHVNLFLEFSDRNGKRKIGPTRAIGNYASRMNGQVNKLGTGFSGHKLGTYTSRIQA